MGGKNSLVDSLLDNEATTSVADETAKSSIIVHGKEINYYRGFCNIVVADEDLPAFQQFTGKDNYKTFSVSIPLDPATNVKGVEFSVSLDDQGYPVGFNQKLHNEASYKIAMAGMSARRV